MMSSIAAAVTASWIVLKGAFTLGALFTLRMVWAKMGVVANNKMLKHTKVEKVLMGFV
jgi:hypothetical protein